MNLTSIPSHATTLLNNYSQVLISTRSRSKRISRRPEKQTRKGEEEKQTLRRNRRPRTLGRELGGGERDGAVAEGLGVVPALRVRLQIQQRRHLRRRHLARRHLASSRLLLGDILRPREISGRSESDYECSCLRWLVEFQRF
jgi:hypothetical protein